MRPTTLWLAAVAFVVVEAGGTPAAAEEKLAEGEAKAIAEEAFIYGYPMVMSFGTLFEFNIDKTSPQYKAQFNQLSNTARVFTPHDTAIVTPNSDTPYSFISMDLRAEPFVLSVPAVDKGRYYSVQLIDLYTDNYGYIGSRATGNEPGAYLVAGPNWKGETPPGIKKVFRCETDFSMAAYRTQLFGASDIGNVKKIQAGYKAQTLSAFLKKPAPPAAPPIKWLKIDRRSAATDPFNYLSFLLQFCPTVGAAEVEKPLRAQFAKIGIEAGKPYPAKKLSPEERAEIAAGMAAGLAKIKKSIETFGRNENGWLVGSPFGDRSFYAGDWTKRAGSAMAGIYGNNAVEALYPMLAKDSDGNKPDCTTNRYTVTFPAGQLPPVNAFWSITMYNGRTQLLVENPLHRYLINSPMLPNLKKNPDGSLTLYLQHDSPGKDHESNWLPAPAGPIYVIMRLYWPKDEAIDGQWKPPAVVTAK